MAYAVIEDEFAPTTDWAALDGTVVAHWSEPERSEVRATLRSIAADPLVVSGSAALLNVVVEGLLRLDLVTTTPIAFLPGGTDHDTRLLADRLGLNGASYDVLRAEPQRLVLPRNDIGGVLLASAEIGRASLKPFGGQCYHDDALVLDGRAHYVRIEPDYDRDDTLVSIVAHPGRKGSSYFRGRSVQIACDAVPMLVDGRDRGDIETRTWYVDDRSSWLLRGAVRPEPRELPQPRGRTGLLGALFPRR